MQELQQVDLRATEMALVQFNLIWQPRLWFYLQAVEWNMPWEFPWNYVPHRCSLYRDPPPSPHWSPEISPTTRPRSAQPGNNSWWAETTARHQTVSDGAQRRTHSLKITLKASKTDEQASLIWESERVLSHFKFSMCAQHFPLPVRVCMADQMYIFSITYVVHVRQQHK